jgi:hypothetical protein
VENNDLGVVYVVLIREGTIGKYHLILILKMTLLLGQFCCKCDNYYGTEGVPNTVK